MDQIGPISLASAKRLRRLFVISVDSWLILKKLRNASNFILFEVSSLIHEMVALICNSTIPTCSAKLNAKCQNNKARIAYNVKLYRWVGRVWLEWMREASTWEWKFNLTTFLPEYFLSTASSFLKHILNAWALVSILLTIRSVRSNLPEPTYPNKPSPWWLIP